MIFCVNNTINVYPTVITFIENGENKTIYTDSPSNIENMLKASPNRFTNVATNIVTLTDDEKTRLADLIATGTPATDGFSYAYTRFVKEGYIPEDAPDVMKTGLMEKYGDITKNHLLDNYSAKIADIRYSKEISGIEFKGCIVSTDRESQSTITSTSLLFQQGIMDSIDFKCKNNQWITCNRDEFQALTIAVAAHVKICFMSESKLNGYLASLPLEDLYKYDGSAHDSTADIAVLFDNTYNEIKASLANTSSTAAGDANTTETTEVKGS